MIKQHFKNKKAYYLSSLILLVGFLVVSAVFGAWPFGTKTIAHYDMYHQIVPFLELIFDAIEGRSTLIYSNYVAGGANIVGFLSYLAFNPFYLILLPFGSNNIWFAINLVFIVNIIAITNVFIWFMRKYFKLGTGFQIALGILYGLNPFILFNYTYITWLMFPLLLPILVHFFIRIIKGKNIVGFTITAICMIFTCYGIGLMGHLILFVIFTIFTLVVLPKYKHKDVMVKLFMAYGLTLTSTLFFLGPNFLQITESSRLNSGFFDKMLTAKLFKNVIYGTSFLMIYPMLLSVNIFFLAKFTKRSRFSQFLMISLVLCFVPIIIDAITLILSMGEYYGYNMRLAYVSTFVMFLTTIYTIQHYPKHNLENIKPEKYSQRTVGFVLGISAFISIICPILTFNLLSFVLSHSIASKHTIGFTALMYLPLIIIATIILIKLYNRKFSFKFSKRALSTIFIIPLVLNIFIFTGMGFYDTSKIDFWKTTCTTLNLEDTRLKEVEGSVGSNIHLSTGFSSLSGFASQIHAAPVKIGEILGYYYSGNIVGSDGGTVLSDAFLGYKYAYSKMAYNRPYLTCVSEHIIDDEVYYLYENSLALNNAILIPQDSFFEYSEDIGFNTNALYKYLGGTENIIIEYSMQDMIDNGLLTAENISLENNTFTLQQETGTLHLSTKSSSYNKIIYCEFKKDRFFDFVVESQETEPSIYLNKFYDMGYVAKNSEYTYQIIIDKTLDYDDIKIYELNYDLVSDLLLSLQNQNVNFEFTKSGYNINTVANNQKLIITNANISGNTITVNGINTTPSDLPFIEINLVDCRCLFV